MIDAKERSPALSIYVTGVELRTTNPRITKSAFKRFLHRAHTICSEKYIKEKTQFLIDMLVENGHMRKFQENLVKD